MKKLIQTITPCLWFNGEAEAAATFYLSIFKNSKITEVGRYTEAGREHHGQKPGSAMIVAFQLDGHTFTALNGGPQFKFSEAISLQVNCDTQKEIDYYWAKLSKGGEPSMCGWLKDKFGLSWQIVPRIIGELMTSKDPAKAERVMTAVMQMQKPNIAKLQKAYAGK